VGQGLRSAFSPFSRPVHLDIKPEFTRKPVKLDSLVEAPKIVTSDIHGSMAYMINNLTMQLGNLVVRKQRDEAIAPGKHDDLTTTLEAKIN